MTKTRTNTGFGPSYVTLTGTTGTTVTSGWQHFGPFLGSNFTLQAVFSETSAGAGSVVAQGTLTTASTVGIVALATRLSSQSGTQVKSTEALIYGWVRFNSTLLASNETITAYFGALA